MTPDTDSGPGVPDAAYPSAPLLNALAHVRSIQDRAQRSRDAWAIVVQALRNPDGSVVLDYALEHGLVLACDVGAGPKRSAPTNIWRNPTDGSAMIWVAAGPFRVGSEVSLAQSRGFSLARHPVTNAQFNLFLDETGYQPPAAHPNNDLFLSHWRGRGLPADKADHPVVWVSFVDALHYCRWAGLSLPSEWQWEKAARGADGRSFPWGEESPAPGRLANVCGTDTCPVGRFSRVRTPYGCEGLVGNVAEWCQPTPGNDATVCPDPWPDVALPAGGTKAYYPVRGACFLRRTRSSCSAAHRRRLSVSRRNRWTGFRPAFLFPCRPAE